MRHGKRSQLFAQVDGFQDLQAAIQNINVRHWQSQHRVFEHSRILSCRFGAHCLQCQKTLNRALEIFAQLLLKAR
ncbi:hypothetical protein D3C76_1734580 [compost metagenome]